MDEIIRSLAAYALPVLFAITLHEAAHGYVAKFFGDDTAAKQGRLSLNPARHIDLYGTIILPLFLYLATIALGMPAFTFGYAKPVPIDYGKLRNPKRDMVWVALAGPAANFLMAFLWVGLLVVAPNIHQFFIEMAKAGLGVNLLFLALNLFPLPPLDGGRVLIGLLPNKESQSLSMVEPYGMYIVMLLAMTSVFRHFWISPVAAFAGHALDYLVYPLKLLLN